MMYSKRLIIVVALLLTACAGPGSDSRLDSAQFAENSSAGANPAVVVEQPATMEGGGPSAKLPENSNGVEAETVPVQSDSVAQSLPAVQQTTTETELISSINPPTLSPLTGEIGNSGQAAISSALSAQPSLSGVNLALQPGGLYGTDGFNLYLIDKSDGSETLIGSHGAVGIGIGALEFDHNGLLYGMSIGGDSRLYTIDPISGAATEVGPLGLDFVFEGGLGFNASGQLLGVNQGNDTNAKMFSINISTGAAMIIGPTPGENRDIDGIAVEGTTFWAVDRVSNSVGTLDPVTGTYSVVGVTGPIIGATAGLAVDPVDGTLYATFANGSFYSLNKTTGAATLIGSNSARYGLAFLPNQPPVLTANQLNVSVQEGQTALNSGTVSDPDGDTVTLTASVGVVANNGDGTWSWSFTTSDGPAESQLVTITGDDGHGAITTTDFALTVDNVAPTPDAGPDQTVSRNELVTLSGTWTDPAGNQDNPYAWSWDRDGDGIIDSSGVASYGDTIAETTSFALEGFYTLTFAVTDKDAGAGSDSMVVEVVNQPPDCSDVRPSIDTLWPPNHRFFSVGILGVTDPEGDPVTITVDRIFQDEAVDTPGSGNTGPDGQGIGTATAEVRAERAGGGNGRVYHITVTAVDGHGGMCSSEVLVGVPHDMGPGGGPIDDGALYDSTQP